MNETVECQSLLNSIYEGADLPVFVLRVDQENTPVYEWINAAYERLTGMKNAVVKGKIPAQLPGIPTEAAGLFKEKYEKCIREKKPVQYKMMLPIKEKETHWFTTLTPLMDTSGRVYRIVGTSMFINQLIDAQHELELQKNQQEKMVEERTRAALESDQRFQDIIGAGVIYRDVTSRHDAINIQQEAAEKYRFITEATNHGIWDWNLVTNQVYYSPEWKKQIGYQPAELDNVFQTWQDHLHPEDRDRCMKSLNDYLDHPKGKFILEFRFRHKQGHYIWIHNEAASKTDNKGNITGLFGIHTDITRRKKLEAEKDKVVFQLNERIKEVQCLYKINEHFRTSNRDIKYLLQKTAELIPGGWQFPDRTSVKILFDNVAYQTSDSCNNSSQYIEEDLYVDNTKRGTIMVCLDTPGESADDFNTRGFLEEEKVLLKEIASSIGQHITNIEDEIAIRENETKFRNLFDHSPLPKAIIDLENNIELINNSFTEIIGYLPEDIPNLKVWWLKAFPDPNDREKIRAEWNSRMETSIETNQPAVPLEAKISCKNGKDRIFSIIGHKIGEKLLVVFSDLTERIEAEEERDRFFTVSLNMLCIATTDGNFKRLNPSWQEVLGWSQEELMSKPFIEFVHPDDVEKTIHEFENLEDGNPIFNFTNRYLCKDGSYRWLTWNTNPSGEMLYAAATDITEQVLATEELQRSNRELEQFAYVASHDLQQPLRMVSSYTQLLEKRYKNQLDEKADKYIYYAVDGAQRMQELINDLLDYSRVTTKGEEFTGTDLNNLIECVLGNLKANIQETGAVIHIDKMPQVVCDSSQISRVFQNLIENAIKFTGDRKPEINIGISEEKNDWVFSVKDNGIGIDPKFSEKVFGIFQRLHHRDEYPGSGIGLSICKRILNRHGGDIWFDSDKEKGTTFYFNIPKNLK